METNLTKTIEYKLTAVKSENQIDSITITASEQAAQFCRNFYFDDILIYESFFLILLSRAKQTIAWVKISQGGINGTVCDPRLVVKYAADTLASAIILCHNHPSGATRASNADIELTKKIKAALTYIDVQVFDHIILTEKDYYSFADNGIL